VLQIESVEVVDEGPHGRARIAHLHETCETATR